MPAGKRLSRLACLLFPPRYPIFCVVVAVLVVMTIIVKIYYTKNGRKALRNSNILFNH